MPVIGTQVPGIQNIVQHGATGYLCDTDADSIASAINTVLVQPRLMEKLGTNARQYALEHYSLEQVARREYELLLNVIAQNPVDNVFLRGAGYFKQKLAMRSKPA